MEIKTINDLDVFETVRLEIMHHYKLTDAKKAIKQTETFLTLFILDKVGIVAETEEVRLWRKQMSKATALENEIKKEKKALKARKK